MSKFVGGNSFAPLIFSVMLLKLLYSVVQDEKTKHSVQRLRIN